MSAVRETEAQFEVDGTLLGADIRHGVRHDRVVRISIAE